MLKSGLTCEEAETMRCARRPNFRVELELELLTFQIGQGMLI